MHFEGTVNIRASREKVWDFLTDPHAVSQCAPGVESVEIVTPGRQFRAAASVGLGSMKVRFMVDVEFAELDPPRRATLKAHGTAPGSVADGTGEMALAKGPDGSTDMRWTTDITVLGTIASLASRLMGNVAQKLSTDFFSCVKSRIEQ